MRKFREMFIEFFRKWWSGYGSVARDMVREIGICVGVMNRDRFVRESGLFGWAINKVLDSPYRRVNLFMSIAFYLDVGDVEFALDRAMYDRIFYDFDSKDSPKKAFEKAKEFAKSLKDRFGCDAVVSFSGLHGAHITVPLKNPVKWREYSAIWKMLIAPYRFGELIDRNIFEPKRLYRVPYTYNIKEDGIGLSYIVNADGSRMRMEDFDWSLYQPLDTDFVNDVIDIETPFISKIKISSYQKHARYVEELIELPKDPSDLDGCKAVPKCIRNIVSTFKKSGDVDHYQRLVLVWFMKWTGYTVDDVVDMFRRFAKDFNERITKYQVEYAFGLRGRKEDWMFPSCKWFKQHGICLDCGWSEKHSNPLTYTYTRSNISSDIKRRFFEMAMKRGNI